MKAIFWDFDGTLANSAATNIEITKAILRDHIPRLTGRHLPDALKSYEAYQKANHEAKNWRDLYRRFYGMTEDELEIAGPQWQTYQNRMAGAVEPFRGIETAVAGLAEIPQAVCSQNDKANIISWLSRNDLRPYFKAVVGYGCVGSDEQKPHPAPFLTAMKDANLSVTEGRMAYVGDHEADTEFSRRVENELRDQGRDISVVSVAVTWSGAQPTKWQLKPDLILEHPDQIPSLLAAI